MKNILTITYLTILMALVGCDSSSTPAPIPDTPTPPPATAQLQVVHAVTDAGSVNVNVGGPAPPGSALLGLEFNGVSNSEFLPAMVDVSVDGNLPDGTTVELVPATSVDFVVDTRTIIVATGVVGAAEVVVLTQDVPAAAVTGTAMLRFLHAAVGLATVDVYATAPDADLAASAPVATLAYQEASDVLELASGDYQIRITPTGDPATVIMDAGTATLLGGEDLLAVAVDNTTGSTGPITLIVADTTTDDSGVVQDVDGEANSRFVHASTDLGPVDVLSDGVAQAEGLVYTDVATTEGLAPATYNIQVTVAGDPTMELFQADVTFESGGNYEAFALGSTLAIEDDPDEFMVLLAAADFREIATEAKLRLIQGSVSVADGVDIYVVEAGTDITMEDATAAGAVLGDNSDFMSLTAGSYDIVYTVADDATMELLRMDGVALANFGIYTGVFIDDLAVVDTYDIIPLDDLAP